ncbi:urease accessory protein UreD [Undibacterium sp. Jales W-56]|uniref:urease accessory protein UreD n=1 Tax=Undibacterium sp. Jales W-56 TaxID=2897325 RepID=UPI0021CDFA94|nr:urease accessory protein UreD [Undibacterium sp. Jales W-56]MCU6432852.1 urease accessory protein UreD [Undibacterium sp. Jales W-56]
MNQIVDPFILCVPAEPAVKAACQARLTLGFADDAGTTRLLERSHFGPLRVQKPLYPEGPSICHAIVVHPPGGVVGGDELHITSKLAPGAHAFLTTPGAAKWYKANGHISHQLIELDVAAQASLEWLPQETIFFDAAQVRLQNKINLGKGATYIGADILCFGRTASGESFHTGKITQTSEIRREGQLLWFEQGSIVGGSSAMHSPLALAGNTVCASLIAVGKQLPVSLIQQLREAAIALTGNPHAVGVTQMKTVIVARYMGNSSEMARQWLTLMWQIVRPELLWREGVVPRIWNT